MSGTHRVIEELRASQAWPLEHLPMRLTDKYECEMQRVFCIRIPEWLFLPMATGFYDVNIHNSRALVIIAVIQLWIYTLFVGSVRICKDGGNSNDLGFNVMLEMLSDPHGNQTNNHRLWIFERLSNQRAPLANIFTESVQYNKRIDGNGNFVELAQADGIDNSNGRGGGGGGHSGGSPMASSTNNLGGDVPRPILYEENYKRINSLPALACAMDTYLNQDIFSPNSKAFVSPEMLAPEHTFSIYNAFKLADSNDHGDDRSKRLKINPGQLDISNYIFKKNGRDHIRLPWYKQTFNIPWQVFHAGAGFMTTRMFPCRQLNEKHITWTNFMVALCKRSRVRIAMQREASRKKHEEFMRKMNMPKEPRADDGLSSSEDGGDNAERELEPDDDDNDDGGIHNDDDVEERRLTVVDERGERERHRKLDQVFPSSAAALRARYFTNAQWLTNESVAQMADMYKFVAVIETRKSELDDFVSKLGYYFSSQKEVITQEFRDNPKQLEQALENLRTIVYEKFETHCTGQSLDLSEAQRIHNANYTQKNLGNKKWVLPITDPNLSVIENAIIWMMEGYTWKDNVATSQFLCFFAYIGIGDRWRREMNIHLNFLFTGGNGLGKSLIMEVTQKNILETTTTSLNGKSDKADAINGVSSDVVICSDDANLATYFSAVGKDCDAKSHLTTMRTTRAILDMIMEVAPDGTKRTVRKQTHLNFTQIRCLMLGTNESLTDIERNSNGFYQSARALYNRFLGIEVPSYDNEIRTVQAAIAAQSAKTAGMKKSDEMFHDLNIRFDCLRGWAHKLMSIHPDIFNIDMRGFDIVWKALTEHLADSGITSDHPRVAIQAKLWCKQLVLFDAYLHAHCLETSPYKGETITAKSLASWVPVCMEHHVIITMSAFYRFFVPPAMESVLDVLHSLMEDSFKNKDNRVYFPEKRRRAAEVKAYVRETAKMNILSGKGFNINGAHPPKKKQNAAADVSHRDDVDEYADAYGDDDSRLPFMISREGRPPGILDRQQQQPEAEQGEASQPQAQEAAAIDDDREELESPIDATYVRFEHTFDNFAAFAQMRMKATRSPMQPGHSAIVSALERLKNTAVTSQRYVLESLEQTTPTLDDKAPSIIRQALIYSPRDKAFSVHYGVLVKNGHFRGALVKAIEAYCHKWVMPRKVLLAVENQRYPFVLTTMKMAATKDILKVKNPSYVMHTTMAAYHGRQDRTKMLDISEQPMNLKLDKCDIDTFVLMQYFRRQLNAGIVSTEDILQHHPANVAERLLVLARKHVLAKHDRSIQNYPNDWLEEYLAIEYWNKAGKPLPGANPVEEQAKRAAAERFIEKNKIIQSASFLDSMDGIAIDDDTGRSAKEVMRLKFKEMADRLKSAQKIDIYKLASASEEDLRKISEKETNKSTPKEYTAIARASAGALQRKRDAQMYDFTKMAEDYPSIHAQNEKRQAELRASKATEDEILEEIDRVNEHTRRRRAGARGADDDAPEGRRKRRRVGAEDGDEDAAEEEGEEEDDEYEGGSASEDSSAGPDEVVDVYNENFDRQREDHDDSAFERLQAAAMNSDLHRIHMEVDRELDEFDDEVINHEDQ